MREEGLSMAEEIEWFVGIDSDGPLPPLDGSRVEWKKEGAVPRLVSYWEPVASPGECCREPGASSHNNDRRWRGVRS